MLTRWSHSTACTWGLVFDPDKQLDVLPSVVGRTVSTMGSVNADNYEEVSWWGRFTKSSGWSGGTDYSYVLQRNLQLFGWAPQDEVAAENQSFFGGCLVEAKNQPLHRLRLRKRKSLVLYYGRRKLRQGPYWASVGWIRSRGRCRVYFLLGVSQQENVPPSRRKPSVARLPFIHGLGEVQ